MFLAPVAAPGGTGERHPNTKFVEVRELELIVGKI